MMRCDAMTCRVGREIDKRKIMLFIDETWTVYALSRATSCRALIAVVVVNVIVRVIVTATATEIEIDSVIVMVIVATVIAIAKQIIDIVIVLVVVVAKVIWRCAVKVVEMCQK